MEDPSKVQAAAEVSVDVLFVAFEKFLNNAWTASMGPILSAQTLEDIQSRSGGLSRDGQTCNADGLIEQTR